ncbi:MULTISPECIES: cyclic nucleotide-binding domain-containing protein [Arthrospira]|jgi:CRP-like cAMP-binding protein|uniref:Cyclic nucleotide-binding domain-containing protein n=1 Tax=Limnospira platensis NIES-46 TaxID=1236695 RepID=A0A5M3TC03_LIMPL|nr:cyclic nucleotide-binding domain-containing protein [Arthrospira platensis]AMW27018.1 cyclic nucleotide-binding protein [Arthrospira platensis YZ]KDR54693.1 cyclic nucleotide-binding protein [Arthrospira platensis str. Paraca]MBD2671336.1 cyclic nucleotide-binding domain-containing protein [Arthrospira platensis FACHB-439]MBD2712278.1 cyclic nucleotide-binding domain-containing protein [Arthrospira platensis FACHB-835]MDF2211557.1 cyclic nucleotide-binding domain-containing protein [Arthros
MNKTLAILGELSDRDLDWIIANGQQQQLESGMVLITEGQLIEALYIVLDGTLVASVAALGNREVATLGIGEVIGEMSFVDGRMPSATVTAKEPCLVLSVPREKLSEKLEWDALFSLRFYRAVSKFLSYRLRNTVTQFGQQKPLASETNSSTTEIEQSLDEDGYRFREIIQRLRGEYVVPT